MQKNTKWLPQPGEQYDYISNTGNIKFCTSPVPPTAERIEFGNVFKPGDEAKAFLESVKVKKPVPAKDETYYYIRSNGAIVATTGENFNTGVRADIGNVFATKEEAENTHAYLLLLAKLQGRI